MPKLCPHVRLYWQIKAGKIRVTRTTSPPEHRFWNRVTKGNFADDCWIWDGPPNHNGYGQFMISGRVYRSHRYSWELHFGSIPDGIDVLHSCDNPICVNPKHLWLGTALDNHRDKVSKERQARGETNGWAILTEVEVLEIRRLYSLRRGKRDPVYGQGALARMFNTSQANISYIVLRITWKHI